MSNGRILTTQQKLLLFSMHLVGKEIRPRHIAIGMAHKGVDIDHKQVSRQLSGTPFAATKTMEDREINEHRRVVERALRDAEEVAVIDPVQPVSSEVIVRRQKLILQDCTDQCEAIRKRYYWLEDAKIAPGREIQSERMQVAMPAIRMMGPILTFLEYAKASKILGDIVPKDEIETIKNAAQIRLSDRIGMADKIAELNVARSHSGLKSADLEAVGGGSFGGKNPADYMLDAGRRFASLTRRIPRAAFDMLEAILFRDEILWGPNDLTSIEYVKLALDVALFEDRQIDQSQLIMRWPGLLTKSGALSSVSGTGRFCCALRWPPSAFEAYGYALSDAERRARNPAA